MVVMFLIINQTDTSLTIDTNIDEFELRIENIINPKDNSSLEGLYLQAGGVLHAM